MATERLEREGGADGGHVGRLVGGLRWVVRWSGEGELSREKVRVGRGLLYQVGRFACISLCVRYISLIILAPLAKVNSFQSSDIRWHRTQQEGSCFGRII